MENNFDAIVIGSGIGGLTVANILSQMNNKRVLVLEKHFEIGGQTHEFKRKHYSWDVGLHYVGEVKKGEFARMFFDYISGNKLKWVDFPEFFNRYIYPDITFEVSECEDNYKESLIDKFPQDKKAIIKYFKDIKKVTIWNQINYFIKLMPWYISFLLKIINIFTSKMALSTTKEYMDKNFKSKELKSILQSPWFTYLLPPKESSFMVHSMIAIHYIKGASYPEGGSGNIAKTIIPFIERNGGKLLTSREATEIIIKKNKAVGVKVKFLKENKDITEEYYAPIIISDTGSINTFLKLVPGHVKIPFRNKINDFTRGYSNLTLYLGLKESPKKFDIKGENIFFFDDYDHDRTFKNSNKILDDNPNHCVITFSSLKKQSITHHTAEILYYLDYEYFNKWKNQKWLKRDDDYYDFKEKLSGNLIDYINKKIGGFKDLIDYKELSSPLSMEYFTNHPYGGYHGIPSVPDRYKQKWLRAKTPVKNLYLTGSDICSLGVVGAMMGGVATASYLNGSIFGFFKILLKCIKNSKKKLI